MQEHKYPEEVRQAAIRQSLERGHNFHEIERAKRARTIGMHFVVDHGANNRRFNSFHFLLIHAEMEQSWAGGEVLGIDRYIERLNENDI